MRRELELRDQIRSVEPRQREPLARLDAREHEDLKVFGTFRLIERSDVAEIDVQRLLNRKLIEQRTVFPTKDGTRLDVLNLTTKGHAALKAQQDFHDDQRYWSNLPRANNVGHDLEVYRAFKQERAAIELAGGKVQRVLIEDELKSLAFKKLNRPGGPTKAELAKEFDIPMEKGRLVLPDVQIRYVDEDGRAEVRSVEVATGHYRAAVSAGKAQHFKMYGATRGTKRPSAKKLGRGSSRSGAAIWDDHNRIGWL